MPTPNIPDEVPDEVMDVLLNVFNSGGHVSQYHAMRAAFVAALPLLLEQVGWVAPNAVDQLNESDLIFIRKDELTGGEPLYRLKVSNEQ